MMRTNRRMLGAFAFCALAAPAVLLAGCLPPGSVPAKTATAQVQAQQTMLQETVQAAMAASAAPTSPPPAPSTETPGPTSAATATVAPNPTSSVPIAVVNSPTNCRSGNGTVFDLLYAAPAGTELPITGRTTLTDYILVEDPNHPGTSCWLWTRYVDIRGDISALPISTPPPTPTPALSFNASYDYMEGCVGWDPAIRVENDGGVTLHSWQLTVDDLDTSTSVTQSANDFDKLGGCPVETAIPQLDPGDTGYAYGWTFAYDPSGHDMKATIKVCTGTNLGGMCDSQTFSFTP
jgi:uncharacterized protein YraI